LVGGSCVSADASENVDVFIDNVATYMLTVCMMIMMMMIPSTILTMLKVMMICLLCNICRDSCSHDSNMLQKGMTMRKKKSIAMS